jgi:hypothetical protein
LRLQLNYHPIFDVKESLRGIKSLKNSFSCTVAIQRRRGARCLHAVTSLRVTSVDYFLGGTLQLRACLFDANLFQIFSSLIETRCRRHYNCLLSSGILRSMVVRFINSIPCPLEFSRLDFEDLNFVRFDLGTVAP